MGNRFKLAALAALVAASACTVHQADKGPDPFGPSGLALDIRVTATPDSISQDGASQSSVIVTAGDATGAAKAGVVIRLDMQVDGVVQDFGRLSARSLVTGTDGRASAIYTAPPSSPMTGGAGTLVTIIATPTGSNYKTATSSIADIRLVPPGVILPPAETPTAQFTISPSPVDFNIASTFDASTSCGGPLSATGVCPTDPISNSAIVSYAWSFGDGATATGKIVSHTYVASTTPATSFTVTLTVTNDRGLAASTTQVISVNASPAPTGDWVSSPGQPAVGETVYFNADGIRPAAGHTLVQFSWNFGDGTTASGFQTTHAYAVAATYTVVLSVLDDAGQKTVLARALTIGSGNPVAAFTSSVVSVAAHRMLFDASGTTTSGSATITSYQWTFGDTFSGSGQTVTHDYAAAQTVTVTLTVTDSLGRTGRTSASVTVP